MTSKRLLQMIGDIDDEYIAKYAPKERPHIASWIKVAAACICTVMIAIPLLTMILKNAVTQDDLIDCVELFDFDGARYEYTDSPEVLKRYGLPSVLTEDDTGEHLTFLEKYGNSYRVTDTETDIELYEYSNVKCKSVLVLRDGVNYYAALFCGFSYNPDSDSNVEFSEFYSIYGVESADDIKSICETEWNFKFNKNIVSDRTAIETFYKESLNLIAYGNDDYQKMEVEIYPSEEERVKHYNEFADDSIRLRFETSEGMVFYISAYPKYGWLYGLSYYKFNAEMTDWFSAYFK